MTDLSKRAIGVISELLRKREKVPITPLDTTLVKPEMIPGED